MREVKALPRAAADATPTKPGGWSLMRGWLFVAGSLVLLLAGLAHSQIAPQRNQLDIRQPKFEPLQFDVQRISLTGAWDAWKHFRDLELDYRQTPEFLENRKKHRELSFFLYTAWACGLVGLGLMVGTAVWPRASTAETGDRP